MIYRGRNIAMNTIKTVVLPVFLVIFSLQLCLPEMVFSQEDKKKEELRRKLLELKKKKSEIEARTVKKRQKLQGQQRSLPEVIAKYEKLYANCKGKKSERCASIMYDLSKMYYDKGRDDYINARTNYEKRMDRWEKDPQGPEPVNPIPDYTKSLSFYYESVKQYPDFVKADEGYYQIGMIETLNGNIDKSNVAYKKLLAKFPNSIRASAAHFRRAEFCFMDRDFTCALKHLKKIKKKELNLEVQEMAHYREAEIYYSRAEFDKAVDLFFSYIDKCDRGEYPKKDLREEALEYLAISFSDMPNGGKKAFAYFKKVGKRPYEDYVIYTIGMKNFNHGQYDQAILALRTALKRFPYYKDAPLAQQMIVACFVIRKKYDEANKERGKLVDYYSPGSEWHSNNANDAVALEKAGIELRKALAAIPIYYHAEAQKKKNKALFEKALNRYHQYISDFPGEKWKVYEFRYNMAEIHNSLHNYEKAAEYYDYVATQNLSTYPRFEMELDTLGMEDEEKERMQKKSKKQSPVAISQEDAGYNAIVAFDNLRKKIMKERKLADDKSYNLPETQKFLEYIHTFAAKFTKSSSTPKVLYLAGNVHYSAKAYDAAIVEFKKIIANYSTTKHGKKAMRMLANTYAAAGEYNMALEKYKDLLVREKPNTPDYKEVIDLAAGALFKNASSIKKSGNLIGAADAFKSISAEFPTSNIAARGWFEAGVSLEKANNRDLAAVTFMGLGEKFPKSKLREKAYVRAAKNYIKLGDFKKAGETYEVASSKVAKADYAVPSLSAAADNYKKAKMYNKAGKMYEATMHRYPKDKRVPLAIYNGALIFEKAKLYPKAIELYTVLSNKYPKSEYAADGYYAIGFCYKKMKDYSAMAKAFNSYGNKFTTNRSKQVAAFVQAAEAYIKMEKLKDAQINAQSAVAIYEKFHKKAKIDPSAAAKAYYALGRVKQKQMDAIKLSGKSAKAVQTKLKGKTKALEPALKAYAKSIEIGVGEWTIRSTYQIGKGFVDFADAFKKQTLFGNTAQKTASKIKISSSLEKYYQKAMEKFEWNINKAYEQNIKNKWVNLSENEFMRIAYRRGHLFEEIGLIFKNAPVPRNMDKEEKQIYKDVLEEKYLEALDAALPKYEEAIDAAKHLGIVGNEYTDSIKARIEFINPSSPKLDVQITEREEKPIAQTDEIEKPEPEEERREEQKIEFKKEEPPEPDKQDTKKRKKRRRKKNK